MTIPTAEIRNAPACAGMPSHAARTAPGPTMFGPATAPMVMAQTALPGETVALAVDPAIDPAVDPSEKSGVTGCDPGPDSEFENLLTEADLCARRTRRHSMTLATLPLFAMHPKMLPECRPGWWQSA